MDAAGKQDWTIGLGNEGAADARAAVFEAQRVYLAQYDAHGRKDGDMKNGVELSRDIIRLVKQKRDSSVAQIDHLGGPLPQFRQDSVSFCSR